MNEIKILGAFGTKAKGYGTTSFYLDEKNTIDAGNLLKSLKERSAKIENIWLTHSHLDHISDIAYILDNYYSERTKTLNLIGLPETIQAIKKHFLNGLIWPDFSVIPMINSTQMTIKYTELDFGVAYKIDDNSSIEAFETDHTVASCGYIYKKNNSSILITSDTYSIDNALSLVDSREDITTMIIECSFPSFMEKLAFDSKHLTPKLLFKNLESLKRDDVKLCINHIKPLFLETMVDEILSYRGKWHPIILNDDEIINF